MCGCGQGHRCVRGGGGFCRGFRVLGVRGFFDDTHPLNQSFPSRHRERERERGRGGRVSHFLEARVPGLVINLLGGGGAAEKRFMFFHDAHPLK